MKTSFSSLLLCAFSFFANGQGQIISLSVEPADPTTADAITLYANVQFTSGPCDLDGQNHSVIGFTIGAYAHHCMGLLTVICPNTDTFQIGQLPAGDYTFDFTLTSGFGGSGCSPGIIPDGDDQIQFTVSESVGIQEYVDADISLYPNPADDRLFFPRPMQQTYYLADPSGKLILDIPPGTFELDISGLRPGMYLLRSSDRTFKLIKL